MYPPLCKSSPRGCQKKLKPRGVFFRGAIGNQITGRGRNVGGGLVADFFVLIFFRLRICLSPPGLLLRRNCLHISRKNHPRATLAQLKFIDFFLQFNRVKSDFGLMNYIRK